MNAQVTRPGRSTLSGRVTVDVYRLRDIRPADLGLRGRPAGRRLPAGGGDERGEPLGGGAAHTRKQVLVGVHRERGMGVTETFGHDLDRGAVGHVIVTVNPPAVPTSLRLDVKVGERDGIIGVTGIGGSTSFETNRVGDGATLTLIDGVPVSATRVQVRFKKGDDVWELTADTTTGTAIDLTVPNGETDRSPDKKIDWVLFTAIDANEHVVDAGGGLI